MNNHLRHMLKNGLPASSGAAYGFAIGCFVLATIIRLALNPISPNIQSLLLITLRCCLRRWSVAALQDCLR